MHDCLRGVRLFGVSLAGSRLYQPSGGLIGGSILQIVETFDFCNYTVLI